MKESQDIFSYSQRTSCFKGMEVIQLYECTFLPLCSPALLLNIQLKLLLPFKALLLISC